MALAQVLEQVGCPSYLEASRRGGVEGQPADFKTAVKDLAAILLK